MKKRRSASLASLALALSGLLTLVGCSLDRAGLGPEGPIDASIDSQVALVDGGDEDAGEPDASVFPIDSGGPVALDLFAGGTFTRASEGSYLTGAPGAGSPAFLAWAGNDTRRIENRGDGLGEMLLLEGSRTNSVAYARDTTNATYWGGAPSATATTGSTAPDGAPAAVRWTGAGGTTSRFTGGLFPSAVSLWYRSLDTGAYSAALGNTTPEPYSNSGGVWARASRLGGGTFIPMFSMPGAPLDVEIDLCQVERGAQFPSSAIRTSGAAVTRAADALTYAVGQYPPELLTRGFRITVAPDFSSAELVASATRYALVQLDSGDQNVLYLAFDGANAQVVLRHGSDRLIATVAWSRNQLLTITVQPNDDAVTLAGFTAGDGTYAAGGSFSFAPASLHIGRVSNGDSPMFGRFGRYLERP